MMLFASPAFLSFLSVVIVSAIPLLCIGFFFIREDLVRRSILFLVSFSTGALLGDVFLHMIPEMSTGQDFTGDLHVILAGIVVSFAIEKLIHWRHCHVLPSSDDHEHEHAHHHPVGMLMLIGDAIHNFIDGLVIAASYFVSVPIGIATTIAVMLHEIPQEIGNFAILIHSGYTRKQSLLFNLFSQSLAILGAIFLIVTSNIVTGFTDFLLPFAAGNFLYIAGSDLIPELHKETGTRYALLQLLFMILGILMMLGLTFLD